ncbi:MAG: MFS transporter [Deltaproteobacteria bacterium]|nr:MFS transporter [Deltaproteobacteria bacterium]
MENEGKIFYGWWIVTAVFIVLFAGLCSGFYTVSVFLEPLQKTFGWSRTEISLGFTIAALLVGLCSPLVGLAVSKLGVKKVLSFGSIVMGLALIMLGFIQQLWQYYALFVVLAVGLACVGLVPCQTIISFWFEKRRGTAMGIIMTGIGLGGMVMVFLTSMAVDAFDWRWAYRLLGAVQFIIVLPVVLVVIKDKPEDIGLKQDGVSALTASMEESPKGISFTVGEAVKTLPFYLICLLMVFYSVIVGGMTQHAIALLRASGVAEANLFWSLALGASVIGRLLFGALADRFSKKGLIIVTWIFHIIGLGAILFLVHTSSFVWVFVGFYGVALGAFGTLFPLFLGERFGVEHFSKLIGIAGLFQIIGLAGGALLLGKIFDSTGAYTFAVQISIIISVIAAFVTMIVGQPKKETVPLS